MDSKKIQSYYRLTKPGIIYGNAITTAAGFFFASKWHPNPLLLLITLVGLSGVIASACVFNNYIDRDIDKKMERTKKRALVVQSISPASALIFATILGILGFSILLFLTNFLTACIAFVGFVFYVVLYGFSKRKSEYGTLVGSVSGAVPPVVGYTAVTNRFDIAALLLFVILVAWQMPHFYAIAIYRLKDYANAGIPVLSVKRGIATTKIHILFYILLFLVASSLLTIFKFTGIAYLTIVGLVGLVWLVVGVQGFTTKNTDKWARKMFFLSLVVTLVVSVMISIGGLLP